MILIKANNHKVILTNLAKYKLHKILIIKLIRVNPMNQTKEVYKKINIIIVINLLLKANIIKD